MKFRKQMLNQLKIQKLALNTQNNLITKIEKYIKNYNFHIRIKILILKKFKLSENINFYCDQDEQVKALLNRRNRAKEAI